jgi:hypothetical protein
MKHGSPPSERPPDRRRWWYLLFVLPFLATLFPQLYDAAQPTLGGIPFFYWYQLLWVVLTGALTVVVYLVTQ